MALLQEFSTVKETTAEPSTISAKSQAAVEICALWLSQIALQ